MYRYIGLAQKETLIFCTIVFDIECNVDFESDFTNPVSPPSSQLIRHTSMGSLEFSVI